MLNDRLTKLKAYVQNLKEDFLLIKGHTDLNYYTGMHLSEGMLFVSSSSAVLYVDSRYTEACKKSIQHLLEVRLWERDKNAISEDFKGVDLLVDPSILSATEWLDLEKIFGKHLKALEANTMQRLRLKKDAEEIEKIRFASKVTTAGLSHVLSLLKEGVTEIEISQQLELYWLKEYGARPAFESIIAFGENTACPHYTPDNTSLRKGDFVLIDLGAKVGGYCSDMTRTFYWKESSLEKQQLYEAVLLAYHTAFNGALVGMTGKDLDHLARCSLNEQGYGEYFSHSLGHGVGMEVHESPYLAKRSKDTIEDGSVFTLEPGAYISGLGGVRIEDTVAFIDGKLEVLTPFTKDPQL